MSRPRLLNADLCSVLEASDSRKLSSMHSSAVINKSWQSKKDPGPRMNLARPMACTSMTSLGSPSRWSTLRRVLGPVCQKAESSEMLLSWNGHRFMALFHIVSGFHLCHRLSRALHLIKNEMAIRRWDATDLVASVHQTVCTIQKASEKVLPTATAALCPETIQQKVGATA